VWPDATGGCPVPVGWQSGGGVLEYREEGGAGELYHRLFRLVIPVAAALAVTFALSVRPVIAQVDIAASRRVLTLPQPPGKHWVWAGDLVSRRSALFDADNARMLGMIDGGYGVAGLVPLTSRQRNEVYAVESIYSRGHRGVRSDIVTIYDSRSLQALADVEVPAKRADVGHGMALSTVLDGGRFFLVFNQTPATSVSVVDLRARRFVGEIDTPGCALVYAVGARRFAMLCGDGKVLAVTLDENGRELDRVESPRFFDATKDPVTEKAVRVGDSWLFASFDGQLHEVDFSGRVPQPRAPWSLFTSAQRSRGWRVGGTQHLAAHVRRHLLYSLVHRGGPGTHKAAGSEVWVYDLTRHVRTRRFEVSNLSVAFLKGYLEDRVGMRGGVLENAVVRVAGWFVPNLGADNMVVTQDESPVLILGNTDVGALAVFDALSGEHMRDVNFTGVVGGRLVLP